MSLTVLCDFGCSISTAITSLLKERTKMLLNSDFLNSLRLCYEVFSK